MMKQITDKIKVSADATGVGIVSRMEKKGYLICYTDREDKRNKIVELTEKAIHISQEMQSEIKECRTVESTLRKASIVMNKGNAAQRCFFLLKNKGFSLGTDDYMVKPVDLDEISAVRIPARCGRTDPQIPAPGEEGQKV